jgi:hypothetical protein
MKNGTAISGKTVGPVDDVLRDDLRVEDIELIHQGDAADDQRERDRHAKRHSAQKRQREHSYRHVTAPLQFFGFTDRDEVLFAGGASEYANKVINQNDAG